MPFLEFGGGGHHFRVVVFSVIALDKNFTSKGVIVNTFTINIKFTYGKNSNKEQQASRLLWRDKW